jgi:hypothetical protein
MIPTTDRRPSGAAPAPASSPNNGIRVDVGIRAFAYALTAATLTGCGDDRPAINPGDPDAAFDVVREQVCQMLFRCGTFEEPESPVHEHQDCLALTGRGPVYQEPLDEDTAARLESCVAAVDALDRETCRAPPGPEDILEGLPECATVSGYLEIFSGDYDDPCQRAVRKWNTCQEALGDVGEELAFKGTCADGVWAAPDVKVDFKSWSELYLDCTPNPSDCLCDGLPHWQSYTKP